TIIQTGETVNADINTQLIKAVFYKNAPLHDGAMIIEKNKIIAAKCILPVSQNPNLPNDYGLRHRSGLGISETSDALVIIVSEQSGNISVAQNGKIHKITDRQVLTKTIFAYLRKRNDNKKKDAHDSEDSEME
ncbi:MAG: DNA integrity scanning protein DisA nucleotide-binding domain protein, partial [Bacteroidales bacterium]|nr:DNA integrity scanning protein DisA nucleotide-binding domain protein [Bacteroidales bacterium]